MSSAAPAAYSDARRGGSTVKPAHRRALEARLLAVAVILISLVPLFLSPVMPTIDYYNHVSRYYVLTHIDDLQYLRQSYLPAWKILPNLGLDVVAFPIFKVLPPLIAAKCVLGIILVTQFTGVLAFSAVLKRRLDPLTVLFAGILLYSYILSWGFANFLFATGLSFWGLALWVRLRAKPFLAGIPCSVLALVIFFCHGFAFALYGLMLGAIEFGFWLQSRPRRLSKLVATTPALAVQALAPAILFRMAPTSDAGQSMADMLAAHEAQGTLGARITEHLYHQSMAVLRVAQSPYLLLDLFTFVALATLLVWGGRQRLVQVHPAVIPALIVLALLSVLTPPSLFGVGKISDRIPLAACLLLAAGLSMPVAHSRRSMVIVGMLSILLIRLAAVSQSLLPYQADFADFSSVIQRAPAREIIAAASPVELLERDQDAMRCEMYGPLLLPLHGNPVPLFAIPSQQPLIELGELRERATLAKDDYLRDPLTKPKPSFRYYLACGYKAVPAANFDVIARQGRFMLLKAREIAAR